MKSEGKGTLKNKSSTHFDITASALDSQYGRPKHRKIPRAASHSGRSSRTNLREEAPTLLSSEDYKMSREESERIFEIERKAFEELRPQLLKDSRYAGKWVAIVDGNLVDSDSDHRKLVMRVHEKYGYRPIYADKITREKQYVEFPSPE